MLEFKSYEGKTEEDALKKGLEELNLNETDIIFKSEFIEGKLFKSPKYIVNIIKKEEIKDYINEYFKNVSKFMNINIETEIIDTDAIFNVLLVSDNNAILIGKDGKTLNSLQTLIRQNIKKNLDINLKINLDVSNYKVKKLKKIERLVRGIAEDVEASQISVSLDPMNSYERRLVHTIIAEYPNLITESIGEGKERHVTIKYKEQ